MEFPPMKRYLSIVALSAAALAALVVQNSTRGQSPAPRPSPPVEVGPGDQGATLKQPWADPPVKSGPAATPVNSYEKLWNPAVNSGPNAKNALTKAPSVAAPPSNAVDINRDIEVSPERGEW